MHITRLPRWARIRPRMSLRVFMVIIVVVGIPIAWKANSARVQRRATHALWENNGGAGYDYAYLNGEYFDQNEGHPNVPEWLRNLFGDEYFQEVTYIYLGMHDPPEGKRFPIDEDLKLLRDFDHVQILVINSPLVTDAGLAELEGLTSLQELDLKRTRVTPAGVKRLRRLLPKCEIFAPEDYKIYLKNLEKELNERFKSAPARGKTPQTGRSRVGA